VSEFELITITFSFVLGLGVAQILGATSSAIRARADHPMHWMPLAYAASIFLLHIQYWFALFELDEILGEWTWTAYGPLMALAVLLFLSGGVVLPSTGNHAALGLWEDFEKRGKSSLLLLAGYMGLWMPVNSFMDGSWFPAANVYNLTLTILLVAAYFAKGRALTFTTLAFIALNLYTIVFVWSTPADVG
jgi:hypothetical protein